MTSIWLRILPYIAALLIGAAGAWVWQANSYESVIAANEAARQADIARISTAGAAQARQAVEKQQIAEKARDDLDAKATQEKTHDLVENEKLRRAAADSARRLRIARGCRASSGDVPGTASAAGVGDASTVELSAAAGSTVFDIRAGVIADQAALRTLQAYVREVCQK